MMQEATIILVGRITPAEMIMAAEAVMTVGTAMAAEAVMAAVRAENRYTNIGLKQVYRLF